MNTLAKKLEAQFDVSLKMLLALIESCPDELWRGKAGGFYFWQQILHVLCGSAFWLRLEGDAATVAVRAGRFFAAAAAAAMPGTGLEAPSPAYPGLSRLDVIEGQIRHLMYHVGHCDALLRDRAFACPSSSR